MGDLTAMQRCTSPFKFIFFVVCCLLFVARGGGEVYAFATERHLPLFAES
jgi:hypothetical protein